jgi:hypothetical protein
MICPPSDGGAKIQANCPAKRMTGLDAQNDLNLDLWLLRLYTTA